MNALKEHIVIKYSFAHILDTDKSTSYVVSEE